MILVTGATGHLGTAVIQTLLEKTSANQIAALVRDESKASALKEKGVDIRVGSYDDTASLDKAMQGIETVLLIAGTDEENRLRQHQNVVDAAKKAGVQCIAYTSRSLKDRNTLANQLMEGHFQTEDYIKECGLNHVLFRNVLYMDTIPQFVRGEKVFETGIHLPTGHGQVPFALRSEMGEAIAHVLLERDRNNRIYTLTGSESCSFDDVAATLTDLSGKAVGYTPIEKSAFEAQMKERSVPEMMIERVTGFLTDIKNGQEEEVSPDLENLLGRKPASLREGLKVLFNL
jgi:NAD(P)H dehydrogenase (quinone)